MRKRSKYRPKGIRLDNVTWVVQGLKPLASVKSEYLGLCTKNHLAMTDIAQGRGTSEQVNALIAALNMTEAIARIPPHHLGKEFDKQIRAGQDALLEMVRRGMERDNRFVFTGPELAAVNEALEVHDGQLGACTVAELEKAIYIVQAEIKTNRARVIERKETACGS